VWNWILNEVDLMLCAVPNLLRGQKAQLGNYSLNNWGMNPGRVRAVHPATAPRNSPQMPRVALSFSSACVPGSKMGIELTICAGEKG
jgi:hypothetical protein